MNASSLLKIAEDWETPMYVYDFDKIRNQIQRLKSIFHQKTHIHYAMKANSHPEILKLMKEEGCKIDTVSYNEILRALQVGFHPSEIHFTPNGAPFKEYIMAHELGIRMSIDNLSIIEKLINQYPGMEMVIRINPNVMAGGNDKISVGHSRSKFGLDMDQLAQVKSWQESDQLKVVGLHIHSGSDIYQSDAVEKSVEQILKAAEMFINQIECLNLGGGFKVKYKSDDVETDMDKISSFIFSKIKKFEDQNQKELELLIEPGKYLVSEAGCFLMKVTQLKTSYGIKYAFVDSGFHHFIRPMYYEAYHEIVNLSNPKGKQGKYDVVGCLCEIDTFATDRMISQIREGDILMLQNAGAYGMVMSSRYNLRELPLEFKYEKGSIECLDSPI